MKLEKEAVEKRKELSEIVKSTITTSVSLEKMGVARKTKEGTGVRQRKEDNNKQGISKH